jgi:hypothetical protein
MTARGRLSSLAGSFGQWHLIMKVAVSPMLMRQKSGAEALMANGHKLGRPMWHWRRSHPSTVRSSLDRGKRPSWPAFLRATKWSICLVSTMFRGEVSGIQHPGRTVCGPLSNLAMPDQRPQITASASRITPVAKRQSRYRSSQCQQTSGRSLGRGRRSMAVESGRDRLGSHRQSPTGCLRRSTPMNLDVEKRDRQLARGTEGDRE